MDDVTHTHTCFFFFSCVCKLQILEQGIQFSAHVNVVEYSLDGLILMPNNMHSNSLITHGGFDGQVTC